MPRSLKSGNNQIHQGAKQDSHVPKGGCIGIGSLRSGSSKTPLQDWVRTQSLIPIHLLLHPLSLDCHVNSVLPLPNFVLGPRCDLLNNYLVLTVCKKSALCPECLFRRHTVKHIFNCDSVPTHPTDQGTLEKNSFLRRLSVNSTIFLSSSANESASTTGSAATSRANALKGSTLYAPFRGPGETTTTTTNVQSNIFSCAHAT